jgi:nucleoside-diphosphate-sugar epimerase
MNSYAIIGAAGFVGQFLVDEFNEAGIRPTTITRTNGDFMLIGKNVENYNMVDPALNGKKFDVIINLAYPTGDKLFNVKQNNKAIVDLIEKISTPSSKIIHVSTIAVFGFNLSQTVKNEKVKFRRDWPYIESKIHFENILLEKFKNHEVHVVRFGNVWGAKSKTWTVPLMNNVLYNQPTAIYSSDGYCNATDVNNAANYLFFLSNLERDKNIFFHHLAEFYDVRWSHWLNMFSTLFQTEVVYYYSKPFLGESHSMFADVKNAMSKTSPKKIMMDLYKSRLAGSYMRSLISKLPKSSLVSLEKKNTILIPKVEVDSTTFFTIMTCQVPFENVTFKEWTPKVNLDQSWNEVEKWINDIALVY